MVRAEKDKLVQRVRSPEDASDAQIEQIIPHIVSKNQFFQDQVQAQVQFEINQFNPIFKASRRQRQCMTVAY